MDIERRQTNNQEWDDKRSVNHNMLWHEKVPWKEGYHEIEVDFPSYIISGLETNKTPSDEDLAIVGEYQRECENAFYSLKKQVEEISTEIARLRNIKAELKQFAKSLQKKHFACRVIKAPFRKIPVEIHRTILSYCLPLRPSPNRKESPLLFGRVSSIWRRVALSTPEFWTEICINFGSYVGKPFSGRRVMEALRVFADRSQGSPTSVHLVLPASVSGPSRYFNLRGNRTYKDVSIAVSFLNTWSGNNQIRSLHINEPGSSIVLENLERRSNSFNRLESLTLQGCKSENTYLHPLAEDVAQQNLATLLQAPKLKTISLGRRISIPVHNIGQSLPCDYLYSSFRSISLWVHSLKHQFTSLRKGIFFIRTEEFDRTTLADVQDYMTLEELGLHYGLININGNQMDCLQPFRVFRFPNLRRLQMTFRDMRDNLRLITWQFDNLDDVVKSLPSLEELSLFRTWELPIDQVLSFLKHFSRLTTLKLLVSTSEYSDFISFLTYKRVSADDQLQEGSEKRNLPNLSFLSVEVKGKPTDLRTVFQGSHSKDAFIEMVSSRWDVSSSPLEYVYLLLPGFSGRSADKFISRVQYGLKDLADNGLFLEVSTSEEDTFCCDPESADLIHWEDGYIS